MSRGLRKSNRERKRLSSTAPLPFPCFTLITHEQHDPEATEAAHLYKPHTNEAHFHKDIPREFAENRRQMQRSRFGIFLLTTVVESIGFLSKTTQRICGISLSHLIPALTYDPSTPYELRHRQAEQPPGCTSH
ncbi:uncharacterized protein LOC128733128 [Sabethes cyaneus]|uniref:uncharacterized protein LOC128733128 n=1 Tax=Sabethes cyaneus TaxID=53552 RepID=UPI00237D7A77|nr:uncharacterized protein LOC128733128 [Sabethes cyaneus]